MPGVTGAHDPADDSEPVDGGREADAAGSRARSARVAGSVAVLIAVALVVVALVMSAASGDGGDGGDDCDPDVENCSTTTGGEPPPPPETLTSPTDVALTRSGDSRTLTWKYQPSGDGDLSVRVIDLGDDGGPQELDFTGPQDGDTFTAPVPAEFDSDCLVVRAVVGPNASRDTEVCEQE
jgi:hypothetical protein